MRINLIIIGILLFNLFVYPVERLQSNHTTSLSPQVSPAIIREGNEFSTDQIGDAWDMLQFSDISKYLNTSGVSIGLGNVNVSNGLFSALTLHNDAQLDPLFPGLQNAIMVGRYGVNYPIDASTYHCYYLYMKVTPPSPLDSARIFWFYNYQYAAGNFGVTNSIPISPSNWVLYSGDFNLNYDAANSNSPWSSQTQWQGIRIDPSTFAGSAFEIDWFRITDCQSVNVEVTWTPVAGNVEIWMAKSLNTPQSRVIGPISGSTGSQFIDVQGWEPGRYFIGIKELNTGSISWTPLTIDPAPQITFVQPSLFSGQSIFWSMDDAAEFYTDPGHPACMAYTLSNGIMDVTTPSPSQQPSSCVSSGASDPKLLLSLPWTIDTTQYRYFSYRLRQDGNYQNFNTGWLVRLIWRTYLNSPSKWCLNVMKDVPYDVDWETYLLDLHDPDVGTPQYSVGSTPCPTDPWMTRNTDFLRLDINENTTSEPFAQHFDWIRLSKPDTSARNSEFDIKFNLSEPIQGMQFNFYYTTIPTQPRQNVLNLVTAPTPPDPIGTNRVYLPAILRHYTTPLVYTYRWDTHNVATGDYYICIEVIDALENSTLRCSSTIVRIY